jgi:hypothetical protein
MRLFFFFKQFFLSAFREIFVYHHSSLSFRAKLFAAIIVADETQNEKYFTLLQKLSTEIYEDADRANMLVTTTKELVKKVRDNNGLDMDALIESITKDLYYTPRYSTKIQLPYLRRLIELSQDQDTQIYQTRILEFLEEIQEAKDPRSFYKA